MGEYECIDCNEIFWAEEPPYPKDQCDRCKEEDKRDG
jgi:DNA-directed RNA polymerase subunit RPC12/RpoP